MIVQPGPDKVKNFMDHDSDQLGRMVQQGRIQNDLTFPDIGRSMHFFAALAERIFPESNDQGFGAAGGIGVPGFGGATPAGSWGGAAAGFGLK